MEPQFGVAVTGFRPISYRWRLDFTAINSGTCTTHSYFFSVFFFSLFSKLTRQTAALEMVKWADHHEIGRAAEILVMDVLTITTTTFIYTTIKGSCEQLMDECLLVPLFQNESV